MANLPVRERILADLKTRFLQRVANQNDALITWDAVVRQPLSDRERKQNCILSIMEGRERKRWASSMVMECDLPVSIEFEVRAFQGEEYATFMNEVLADIQRTVKQGVQLGGSALYMRETSNQTDISGGVQKVVGGIIFFDLRYRHVADDPTRAIGE